MENTESQKQEENVISAAIKDHYVVVGVVPGVIKTRLMGNVDLRTISKEKADKLVEAGFKYLKPIEKKNEEEVKLNPPRK